MNPTEKAREIPAMEKQYDAKQTESKWRAFYQDTQAFRAPVKSTKKPFVIVIPPPNVTGVLHIGHALNTTLQDVLVRWQRMTGLNALWVPGSDHAGIATQNVVEKHLLAGGTRREDLGREQFIREVWRWKEERGSTIIRQLKHLGASCDWSRERFTMDEGLSRAVREAFIRLYRKGLIYRGDYIVNWCPRCETALSSEEAAHQPEDGKLYYIRYPGEDGSSGVTVATTRPETIFGDVAVAVNPGDKRYRSQVGRKVVLPVLGRIIPVVAHRSVEKGFGTGAVKVTPNHDADDFRIGRDLGLAGITIMDARGVLNLEAGPFAGQERFAAREKLVAWLRENNFLVKVEAHQHGVGRCYRCNTAVEPYLSRQWFVRMKPLAEPALAAARRGKPAFFPGRWEKVYRQWLENIEDWCISRQIWWGHRMPVYYCPDCPTGGNDEERVIVAEERPVRCDRCGSERLRQETDVLDTWFSSWLWPFSVFGWPDKTPEARVFYPTDVLITAPEIIFFWVARMIMAGFEFTGKLPFHTVHIHGTVRDETGRKMSKSYGNVVDPLEVIADVGADSLRFSLVSFAGPGQDLYIGRKSFLLGRNFANKIWNASRLVLARAAENHGRRPAGRLSPAERWIIAETEALCRRVGKNLARQRFNEAAADLYHFFRQVYCDWFLELAKIDEENGRKESFATAAAILDRFLRLLHPFMPFITEEIWSRLKAGRLVDDSAPALALASWPAPVRTRMPAGLEGRMALLREAVTAVRDIRAAFGVNPREKVPVILRLPDEGDRSFFAAARTYPEQLAGLSSLEIVPSHRRGSMEASRLLARGEIFVPLTGLFDPQTEKVKLEKEMTALEVELARVADRLANPDFLGRAPAEVVAGERRKQETMAEKLKNIRQSMEFLK